MNVYIAVSVGMVGHYLECFLQLLARFPQTRHLFGHLPKPMPECVYVGILLYTILVGVLYWRIWKFKMMGRKSRLIASILTANIGVCLIKLLETRHSKLA